jgi:cytochrome c-type biogenesis protein CcmF
MLATAFVVGFAVFAYNMRGPWLAPVGMALAAWLILGALNDLATRISLFKVPFASSWRRFVGLPRSVLGSVMAHGGLGIMIAGIIAVSLWKVETIVALKPGEAAAVGNYSVTFTGETPLTGPNYTGRAGHFLVKKGDRDVAALVSEKRSFKPSGMPTTEVGLLETILGDVYVVMGDTTSDGARAMRMYFNPLVDLIWLGALIMFLGGLMSLSDRRYRVGAPRRHAATQPAAAE